MENTGTRKPTNILFWAISAAALIWNGLGCLNLVQQMSPAGIASLPADYQAFIEVRPSWALMGFSVSVVVGLLGALLLIFRSRLSVWSFVVSGLGAIVATLPTLGTGLLSLIVGSALSIILAAYFAWFSSRALRSEPK